MQLINNTLNFDEDCNAKDEIIKSKNKEIEELQEKLIKLTVLISMIAERKIIINFDRKLMSALI